MITVHHLNNSRSQRVLWLLEELGLKYEVKRYSRDAKTSLAPPELKAVHPLGKSPVITDDGVTVAESGAITEYVLDKYGKGRLRPAGGTDAHRRYVYWLHYAEGSLMPLLVMRLIFGRMPRAVPGLIRPVARMIANGVNQAFLGPNLKTQLGFVEGELGQNAWFAGAEFSAADIQMSFPLQAALARGGDLAGPKTREFVQRIEARPAYRRALEVGGPFEFLR